MPKGFQIRAIAAATGLALALAPGLPRMAGAQATREPPGRTEPLRPGPADFWSDVHRWTGSDETRPAGGAARPGAAPPAPTAAGASRAVLTSRRSRANIRQDPGLDAPVARVMPPGSRLNVFGEAAGGWFHVGGDAPFGWIHESVLDR